MVIFHRFLYVYQRVIPGEKKTRSFLGRGFIIHRDHGWIQGTLSDPMHALQPKFTKQSMFFGAWNDPGYRWSRWSWCDHGDGRIFRTSPKKPRNPDSSAWKKSVLPGPRWIFPSEATSNWSPENILAITRRPLKTTMISIISIRLQGLVRIFIRICTPGNCKHRLGAENALSWYWRCPGPTSKHLAPVIIENTGQTSVQRHNLKTLQLADLAVFVPLHVAKEFWIWSKSEMEMEIYFRLWHQKRNGKPRPVEEIAWFFKSLQKRCKCVAVLGHDIGSGQGSFLRSLPISQNSLAKVLWKNLFNPSICILTTFGKTEITGQDVYLSIF